MDNHTRLLHDARRRVMWMPLVLGGILLCILSINGYVHCIRPGRICFPFTNDIEWNYTSPPWLDVICYICLLVTYFYYRLMFKKHHTSLKKMSLVAIGVVLFISCLCIILGETTVGRTIIQDSLTNTVFGNALVPEYSAIVFSMFLGTIGGTFIAFIAMISGMIKNMIYLVFNCTLLGMTSGVVAFIELAIHADLLRALLFGIMISVINILLNAICIASAGLPIILLQKLFSWSADRKDNLDKARRKRMY